MVEYIVAIDVTRVRFPADALSLLLFVLCDFVPTRRKEPLSRGYGATVARLTPDQTVGRSNRSGLNLIVCARINVGCARGAFFRGSRQFGRVV